MQNQFSTLTCILFVVAACQPNSNSQKTPDESVETRLRAMISASETQCSQNSDCSSDVCASAQCVALAEATHTWMEARIAKATVALLKQHPAQSSMLFKTLLPELLTGDEYVQARVIGFLGHVPENESIQLLKPMLQSNVELVRTRTRLALAALKHDASFAHAVKLLGHSSEAVVLRSIEAIAAYGKHNIHGSATVNQLVTFLNHDNHRIQHRVITVIRQFKLSNPAILDGLNDLLKKEGDAALQYDAYEALRVLSTDS